MILLPSSPPVENSFNFQDFAKVFENEVKEVVKANILSSNDFILAVQERWSVITSEVVKVLIYCKNEPSFLGEFLNLLSTGDEYSNKSKQMTFKSVGSTSSLHSLVGTSFGEKMARHLLQIKSITLLFSFSIITLESPTRALFLDRISTLIEFGCQSVFSDAYINCLEEFIQVLSLRNLELLSGFVKDCLDKFPSTKIIVFFIKCLDSTCLQVYPPNSLQYSTEIMEILACFFIECKDYESRVSVASSLSSMLVNLIPIITAEVNFPKWKLIISEHLVPKLFDLYSRPKYREVISEFTAIVLCLSDHPTFLSKWFPFLQELVCSLKESASPNVLILSILRLLWVYFKKHKDSYSNQVILITKLLSQVIPCSSKKLTLKRSFNIAFLKGMALCMFPNNRLIYLRDVIAPLLEGHSKCELDTYPSKRVYVALHALAYFCSIEKELLPDHFIFNDSQFVFDEAISVNSDPLCSEQLDRIIALSKRSLITLNSILRKECNQGNQDLRGLTDMVDSYCSLIHSIVSLDSNITKDKGIVDIITSATIFHNETISSSAIKCIEQLLHKENTQLLQQITGHFTNILLNTPFLQASIRESIHGLLTSCLKGILNQSFHDSYFNFEETVNLDEIIKCLFVEVLGTRSGKYLQEAIICINDFISILEKEQSNLLKEAEKLSQLLNDVCKDSGDNGDLLQKLETECRETTSTCRKIFYQRFQDGLEMIKQKNDSFLKVHIQEWCHYLQFILYFGPPSVSLESLRKSDTFGLSRILSFGRASAKMQTMKGLLREYFELLRIESNGLDSLLLKSLDEINSAYMEQLLEEAVPYLRYCSKDFTDIKYQAEKANKKQDSMKLHMAQVLTVVAKKLVNFQQPSVSNPKSLPHAAIIKFIVEAYYFCNQIDSFERIHGLRRALANLIAEYCNSIREFHPRYEFLPPRLQAELFIGIQKWFDCKRLGLEDLDDRVALFCKRSSVGDFSFSDIEKTYAHCLASLCYGLINYSAANYHEQLPSGKVLGWIDSLISFDPWGPELVQRAVTNLLSGDPTLVEKILQKIFHPEVIMSFPSLSDAYFIALCDSMKVGKISVSNTLIAALLAFKSTHGGYSARERAKSTAFELFGIDCTDATNLNEVLATKLCTSSDLVISEIVMRTENLVGSKMEAFVGRLLKPWIRRLIIIEEETDKFIHSLLSLVILTLRWTLGGNLEESFQMWNSLCLWKHHLKYVLEVWSSLILHYKSRKLLEISGHILKKMYEYTSQKGLLETALVQLIEIKSCFKVELVKINEASFACTSRLETILQGFEKCPPLAECTLSAVIVSWIKNISLEIDNEPDLFLLMEVMPKERDEISLVLLPEKSCQFAKLNFINCLQRWALSCPDIKVMSWCWQSMIYSKEVIIRENFLDLSLNISSFLRFLKGSNASSPDSMPLIYLKDLFQVISDFIIEVGISENVETSVKPVEICDLLVDVNAGAAANLLAKIGETNYFWTINEDLVIKMFSHAESITGLLYFTCRQVSSLYHLRVPDSIDRLPHYLSILCPILASGWNSDMMEEAKGSLMIMSNIIADLEGKDKDQGLLVRYLQCYGGRRKGNDLMADLAHIMTNPLTIKSVQFTTRCLITFLRSPVGKQCNNGSLFNFITNWFLLVQGQLTGEAKRDLAITLTELCGVYFGEGKDCATDALATTNIILQSHQ